MVCLSDRLELLIDPLLYQLLVVISRRVILDCDIRGVFVTLLLIDAYGRAISAFKDDLRLKALFSISKEVEDKRYLTLIPATLLSLYLD